MDYTAAMARAIVLSEMGLGKTSPNPIVGALILDSAGSIVGEGFHDRMNCADHAGGTIAKVRRYPFGEISFAHKGRHIERQPIALPVIIFQQTLGQISSEVSWIIL